MRSEVVVCAPAKVNLSLAVGRVRRDGYHPLATVYQAIGLYDEVTVRPSPDGKYTLTVEAGDDFSVAEVPTDETNLAVRAAQLIAARHGIDDAVHIDIRKQIPVAGGMAGGSADAAAALVACDALWGTCTPRSDLLTIAAELGSDVPFALVGGTAIGTGRGEVVTPAMVRGTYWWVVLQSHEGLSTPEVYAEFDRMYADTEIVDPEVPDPLMAALRGGDAERLGHALTNDLQPAAVRLRPELQAMLDLGLEASAHGALVSGSGPSCLYLTEGHAHALQVAGWLREEGLGPVSIAPGPVAGAKVVG